MSKMRWFVIVAALVLAGVGGWVTSTKGARSVQVAGPTTAIQVDTLRAMSTAKDLPSPQYDLY